MLKNYQNIGTTKVLSCQVISYHYNLENTVKLQNHTSAYGLWLYSKKASLRRIIVKQNKKIKVCHNNNDVEGPIRLSTSEYQLNWVAKQESVVIKFITCSGIKKWYAQISILKLSTVE